MKDARDLSRGVYDVRSVDGGYCCEQVNAGSLQRIADAMEKIALRYDALISERDMYRQMYCDQQDVCVKLHRQNAALRGVIARMKRAGSGGDQ